MSIILPIDDNNNRFTTATTSTTTQAFDKILTYHNEITALEISVANWGGMAVKIEHSPCSLENAPTPYTVKGKVLKVEVK